MRFLLLLESAASEGAWRVFLAGLVIGAGLGVLGAVVLGR